MKQVLKRYLLRRGWYYRLKYSSLFRAYQSLFKRDAIRSHKKEVEFYRPFINPGMLAFDIGAYDGHKSAAFLDLGAKVVCCEPDEKSLEILRTRFKNNKNISIEPVAISDRAGELTYQVHHPGSAFNTISIQWKELLEKDQGEKWDELIQFKETRTVKSKTLDQLIDKYGVPGFIKIDVEGAELSVLEGLNHAVPALTFESIWPEYEPQLRECLQRLKQLNPAYRFNIAVNEKLILDDFVNGEEILERLKQGDVVHLEIVADQDLSD